MIINLKTSAARDQVQSVQLTITERLPGNIQGPCLVNCEYQVRQENNYYLLTLTVNSRLDIICQRCLHQFPYNYSNTITLAVCGSDELAVTLMNHYECITSQNNQVDLSELLTDELYLYAPDNHLDLEDCDDVVSGFIIRNETLEK